MVSLIKVIYFLGILAFIPTLSFSQKNAIDSLKKICKNPVEDSIRIQNLIKLSKAYIPSNFDSSAYYLEVAYNRAKSTKCQKEEIDCLNLYGVIAWYKNDLQTAQKYFEESYRFSKIKGLKRVQAKASGNIGLICNAFGNYTKGQPYFEEAIDLYTKLGDSASASKNQVDLSNSFSERGLYKEATEQLLAATLYFEKHNDRPNLIFAYFGLGDLYYKLHSFDLSLHYYEESIRMDDINNPTNHISNALMGIGLSYEKINNDLEKAEEYYHRALEAAHEYNYAGALLGVTNNLAGLYYRKKDYAKALEQFKLAYKLYGEGNFYNAEIPIIINIGTIYLALEKYDSARIFLNEGLAKSQEVASPEHINKAQFQLFKLDSAIGDYPSAIEHLKIVHAVHDSLWKQENRDRINELEIRFETEKKDQENIRLKKENELKANIIQNHRTIGIIITLALLLMIVLGFWLYANRKTLKVLNDKLESQKDDLQKLNITKDKFFSIIAHDLKSPFSSLLGLLDMLEEEFDTMSDNEKMEIIVSLQNSSHNTYNLLMNLLEWTRSQRGQIKFEPQEFLLNDSIQNVFRILSTRAKLKVHRFTSEIPEGLMVFTDKMMLESVLLNFVNNSIKFTKVGGHIIVAAIHNHSSTYISVRDNGIGIPSEKIGQLFQLDNDCKRIGTNNELGTGLGLILCNDFVHLMGGTITVESQENKGSVFSFTIPDRLIINE